jgi:hypothetical protein
LLLEVMHHENAETAVHLFEHTVKRERDDKAGQTGEEVAHDT